MEKRKYTIPPYSPKKNGIDQDPLSLRYFQWCKDKIDLYPKSANEIEKLLVDLGEKGANLGVIVPNLQKARSAETIQAVQGPTLKANFKKHIGRLKKEKAIKNAISLLSELKPILCEYEQSGIVNHEIKLLTESLNRFEPYLSEYLDLALINECQRELSEETGFSFSSLGDREFYLKNRLPARPFAHTQTENLNKVLQLCPPEKIRGWIREKRALTNRTHNVWTLPICAIVRELIQSGFSDNSAYKKTAKLFMAQYPKLFSGEFRYVQDQIKQRYQKQDF